jgi:hypothetical protein
MMPPTKGYDPSILSAGDSVREVFKKDDMVEFKVEGRKLKGKIIHDKRVGYGCCVVRTAIGHKHLVVTKSLTKLSKPGSKLRSKRKGVSI